MWGSDFFPPVHGVLVMLAKCANPECTAVFRRLGDGKLFRVPRVATASSPSGAGKKTVTMEHFWLCNKCTETMTLGIDRERSVTVIPALSARGARGAAA